MTIEANSYAPDPLRDTLHVSGPFRLIGGRGIIDSRGRLGELRAALAVIVGGAA